MALESKSQVLAWLVSRAVFELHLLEVIRNTYCTAIIFEHNLQLTYLKCLFGIINVEIFFLLTMNSQKSKFMTENDSHFKCLFCCCYCI